MAINSLFRFKKTKQPKRFAYINMLMPILLTNFINILFIAKKIYFKANLWHIGI